MKWLRHARWALLALLLSLVPASSYAGVFISVGFAPPVMPVYEQPPCPEPGLIWTPGYWAYGPDGYYWVPGTWVPAPYDGALWTPGYWGWGSGLYMWHPGYWGQHVGYYGGVNYGFGYFGIGFAGGRWRGHDFIYNTAVVRVNTTVIRNVYEDRTVIHDRNYVVENDRRVAYSGGPGGIRHDAMATERLAERDQHMEHTSYQVQHMEAARNDRNAYFKANGGHPQNLVASRPLQAERANSQQFRNNQSQQQRSGQQQYNNQSQATHQAQQQQQYRTQTQQQQSRTQAQQQQQYRTQSQQQQQYRTQSQQQSQSRTQSQQQVHEQARPQQQQQRSPQAQPQHESRPQSQHESHPQHEEHPQGGGHGR